MGVMVIGRYYGSTYGPGNCRRRVGACSFDLVNTFKTDAVTGLPLFDTYNDFNITNDHGFTGPPILLLLTQAHLIQDWIIP